MSLQDFTRMRVIWMKKGKKNYISHIIPRTRTRRLREIIPYKIAHFLIKNVNICPSSKLIMVVGCGKATIAAAKK